MASRYFNIIVNSFLIKSSGDVPFLQFTRSHLKNTSPRVRLRFSKPNPESKRAFEGLRLTASSIFEMASNNFDLAPEDVALLYKYRWKIELFFKWIKQHLKVKSFWGTSPNAVKVQIYTAIITYSLVVIIKSKLKSTCSNYEILQILSVALLDKIPVRELLSNPMVLG
jgi:hypothetical protein